MLLHPPTCNDYRYISPSAFSDDVEAGIGTPFLRQSTIKPQDDFYINIVSPLGGLSWISDATHSYPEDNKIHSRVYSHSNDLVTKLIHTISLCKRTNDPKMTLPNSKTIETISNIIKDLPWNKIKEPKVTIDYDGELALYWEDRKYYAELGADQDGLSYFFINDRLEYKNIPTKTRNGKFTLIKNEVLPELIGLFPNDNPDR